MTISVNLKDALSGHRVTISHQGELIVRPQAEYSTPSRVIVNVTDTAFNLQNPSAGENFILTGIILNSTQSVPTSASVDIYEATSATSTTIETSVLTIDVPKGETITIVPLLLKVSEGVFLNVKSDAGTVNCSVLGYFVIIDDP